MKKTLLVISIIAIFASLLISVNAHPGRTDAAGGHTDHSTGEYHYHHGYSAHDHYDMDGDGDKDCPYNFQDKTNHNSSSVGKAESGNSLDIYEDKENTVSTSKKPDTVTFFDVLKAMLSYILQGILIFLSCSYLISFILLPFLGDDKGCSVSIIIGAAISVIAYVWLIINSLM